MEAGLLKKIACKVEADLMKNRRVSLPGIFDEKIAV